MKCIHKEIQSIIKILILTIMLIFVNANIYFIILFSLGYYILIKILDIYLKRRYKDVIS